MLDRSAGRGGAESAPPAETRSDHRAIAERHRPIQRIVDATVFRPSVDRREPLHGDRLALADAAVGTTPPFVATAHYRVERHSHGRERAGDPP